MDSETYNEMMDWMYDDEYSSSPDVLRPIPNYYKKNESPYAEVKLYNSGIDTKDLPHDKVDTVYLNQAEYPHLNIYNVGGGWMRFCVNF